MWWKMLTGFEGSFPAVFLHSVIVERFIVLDIGTSFSHSAARREGEGGCCVIHYVQSINPNR